MTSTLTTEQLPTEYGKKSTEESCGERNKPDDVLEDVHRYIEERKYTISVADLIVGVAANALNINLKIYENDKGMKKEIYFEPDNAKS